MTFRYKISKKKVTDYAYITDSCVNCGFCVVACPCPNTITYSELLERYNISSVKCEECNCQQRYCITACPIGAIKWNDIIITR